MLAKLDCRQVPKVPSRNLAFEHSTERGAYLASMASLQQTPTGRPLSGRKSRFLKRRVLFPHCPAIFSEVRSTEENKSLVEFVLLHGDPHVWPSHSRTSNF